MSPEPALLAALAGRYRIDRELGRGGMATVWLAHDLRHGRAVAIKVIRPELADVVGGERFAQEILTTARLQHPHILPLHDSCQDASCLYYVMPYVEGESLQARLQREGPLPVDEVLRLGAEVADALAYAHRHGVVHRDLKPENILLQAGHALVADFGIALALDRSAGSGRITATGFAIGTPAYMSPEQAFADPVVDGRSDVFSLAVVLYQATAGRKPREAATASAFMAQFMAPVPPLGSVQPTAPPSLDALLQRALALEPADRPDAAAFGAELDRIRRTLAPESASDAPETVPVAPATRDGVAVLEFRNLSGDASVDWLAAGIAETLTVDLRRTRRVRIIPPDRVGHAWRSAAGASTAEVARQVGARYVVAGGYQASSGRLRLTAHVEDVRTGETIADLREDGTLEQVFELQDGILAGVLAALGAGGPVATPPAPPPQPPSLDVYECYARGRQLLQRFSATSLEEADRLFAQALALDPAFAPAHAGLGSVRMFRHIGSADRTDLDAALGHFERAAELDPGLPEVAIRLAYLYGRRQRFDEARVAADQGVAGEPDNDEAYYFRGTRHVIAGSFGFSADFEEGVSDLLRAIELNPDAEAAALVGAWACRLRGDLAAAAAFATLAGQIERDVSRPKSILSHWVGADLLLACVRLDQGQAAEAQRLAKGDLVTIAARDHLYQQSFLAQAHLALGEATLRLGGAVEALGEFGAALAIAQAQPQRGGMGWITVRALAGRARALAAERLRRDAQQALAQAQRLAEEHADAGYEFAWTASAPDAAYDLAAAQARLGGREAAEAWLDRAANLGWANIAGLQADPSFAALLAENRELIARHALPSPVTPALAARLARLLERHGSPVA